MSTIQELAAQMEAAFEEAARDDGAKFWRLTNGSPDWMKGVCRAAHKVGSDLMLPDDARYEFIVDAVVALSGYDDPDDAEEAIEPDCYTADLTAWLASSVNRVDYLTQAREEYGVTDDEFKLLSTAQYIEKREVFEAVRWALDSEADDD